MEIARATPQLLKSRAWHSDRSPLHDVRHHARRPKAKACGFVFPRTSVRRSVRQPAPSGGARRDRTDDLLLAKQALSQLSYGPSPVSYASRHLGLPAEPQLARGNRPPSSFGLRRGSLRLACASEGLVGLGRFELPTSRLSSARSNQLSYKPEPGVSDRKPPIRERLITEYR
jgi:hypothetical protein